MWLIPFYLCHFHPSFTPLTPAAEIIRLKKLPGQLDDRSGFLRYWLRAATSRNTFLLRDEDIPDTTDPPVAEAPARRILNIDLTDCQMIRIKARLPSLIL